MKNLKYLIGVIIVVDLVLVFPVMFSWQAIGEYLKVAAFPEVFTTLVVEITLLVLTALIAYLVSRILKGTALQKALYLIAWGVLMYGVGDTHLLVWMYTGVESFPWFFGQAGSSVAHSLSVGVGFILVILGLYKIAQARKDILPNGQNR